jgi:hypothetical protein
MLPLVRSFNRRVRAAMLRPDPPADAPLTAGTVVADWARMLLFMAALGILAALALTGVPLLIALALGVFGYRPVGLTYAVLLAVFLAVAAILGLLLATFCMIATMWRYRSWRWFVSQLVVSVVLIGGPLFYTMRWKIAPRLDELRHLSNWPAQLELAAFDVCAIEVEESSTTTTAPLGRIVIDLVNRSPVALEKASFSVKGGSIWRRFSIERLAPGERRRLGGEMELGIIEADGDSGWTQRSGEIYWDGVRFAGDAASAMRRRPDIADVQPIPDCPRFDISGVWRGADGTEMQLSQRGSRPRGWVRGGQLSQFANPVEGSFDGATFSGKFEHRAARFLSSGSFELRFTDLSTLDGHWSLSEGAMKGSSGRWLLTRAGPAPPAARRR